MDFDEVRLFFVFELYASRPVRLVANDEIEFRQAEFLLGVRYRLNGLIGRKDHSHAKVGIRIDLGRQRPGVGSRRIGKVVNIDVTEIIAVSPLAYLDVGADGEATKRRLGIYRPFANGLRHKSQRRHKIEHHFADARVILGDLEASKGLARSTRHDQFAAISSAKALLNGSQSLLLVRPKFFLFGKDDLRILDIRGPVDRALLNVGETDALRVDTLVAQRPFGVFTPIRIGSVDDQAFGERLFARGREE